MTNKRKIESKSGPFRIHLTAVSCFLLAVSACTQMSQPQIGSMQEIQFVAYLNSICNEFKPSTQPASPFDRSQVISTVGAEDIKGRSISVVIYESTERSSWYAISISKKLQGRIEDASFHDICVVLVVARESDALSVKAVGALWMSDMGPSSYWIPLESANVSIYSNYGTIQNAHIEFDIRATLGSYRIHERGQVLVDAPLNRGWPNWLSVPRK